jgi:hypothetical protein
LPDRPRLSRAERERRDEKVLRLFLTGLTYREIGAAVGLRSVSGVHRVVQRELAAGARRRGVLTEDAFDVWQERTEALFQVHWERALDGDYRSAELCRKLLAHRRGCTGLVLTGVRRCRRRRRLLVLARMSRRTSCRSSVRRADGDGQPNVDRAVTYPEAADLLPL